MGGFLGGCGAWPKSVRCVALWRKCGARDLSPKILPRPFVNIRRVTIVVINEDCLLAIEKSNDIFAQPQQKRLEPSKHRQICDRNINSLPFPFASRMFLLLLLFQYLQHHGRLEGRFPGKWNILPHHSLSSFI